MPMRAAAQNLTDMYAAALAEELEQGRRTADENRRQAAALRAQAEELRRQADLLEKKIPTFLNGDGDL